MARKTKQEQTAGTLYDELEAGLQMAKELRERLQAQPEGITPRALENLFRVLNSLVKTKMAYDDHCSAFATGLTAQQEQDEIIVWITKIMSRDQRKRFMKKLNVALGEELPDDTE